MNRSVLLAVLLSSVTALLAPAVAGAECETP